VSERITFANVMSVAAVSLSLVTFIAAEKNRKVDLPFDIISKSYEKYYEMTKVQIDKPYLSHLFAAPDQYEKLKRLIKGTIVAISPEKRLEYLIEERAAADFVFTFYEQTFSGWDATKDKERAPVDEYLVYLHENLLQNPRLVYWWTDHGGALKANYEKELHDDWDKNVYRKLNRSHVWCDPVGPFGISIEGEAVTGSVQCE
jgi:hypothetical protein